MHPPAGRRSETRPPSHAGQAVVRPEAGDARTLAALYDRHVHAVYSLAMRIVGEQADAEATTRGVFATAWSEAGRHAGRRAPDGRWLLSMTRVRSIDHVRARGDQGGPDSSGTAVAGSIPAAGDATAAAEPRAGDVAMLHQPDPALGRNTDIDHPDDGPRLRAALRELPLLQRIAIELAYFEGLTISQIATRLEQTPKTANVHIWTGLRRLLGHAGGRGMNEPRHDELPARDLAALYALGALNATERAAFDAHLEVHRESVDEVLSLLPVTRRLAWAAPPHEPPPGLRERLIESVTGAPLPNTVDDGSHQPSRPTDAGDSSEPVAAGHSSEPAAVAGDPGPPGGKTAPLIPAPPVQEPTPTMQKPTPPVQQPTPTVQKPTPTAQKKGGRAGLLLLAAGSLAVAAGLGWYAARQANLATALQENLDAANTQTRIAELETTAAQRIVDELRGGTRILAAADVQTLDLAGQPVAPAARGRLFWSASEGGVLTVTGLPPVPPGRVYQLWLIPDTSPVSAALLSADAEGRVMAAVTAPDGVTEPVPAAVTLEPTGGSAEPGGDVYLLGRP